VFASFFSIFYSFSSQSVDRDQNWGKEEPYLEGIEAKFQRDTLRHLRCLETRGILGSSSQTYSAVQPRVRFSPKFIVILCDHFY